MVQLVQQDLERHEYKYGDLGLRGSVRGSFNWMYALVSLIFVVTEITSLPRSSGDKSRSCVAGP